MGEQRGVVKTVLPLVPFALYLLTALSTGVQVLGLVVFIVWGRGVRWQELLSLVGSGILLAASVVSLFRSRLATHLALSACFALWGYYSFALYNAWKNITEHESQYPWQAFVPPILLFVTSTYVVAGGLFLGITPDRFNWRPFWKFAAVLGLSAALLIIAPAVSLDLPTPDDLFVPRRMITVPMSWKRGDRNRGRNFVRLSYAKGNGNCIADFFSSAAFADYIESFGSRKVPVTYEVSYDQSGEAISANFSRVGGWSVRRFSDNEGGPSREVEVKPGEPGVRSRIPQDCFDALPTRK